MKPTNNTILFNRWYLGDKNKLTPEQLADEFMKNFSKDRFEMNIGKTKLMRTLKRLAPNMADKILKNN